MAKFHGMTSINQQFFSGQLFHNQQFDNVISKKVWFDDRNFDSLIICQYKHSDYILRIAPHEKRIHEVDNAFMLLRELQTYQNKTEPAYKGRAIITLFLLIRISSLYVAGRGFVHQGPSSLYFFGISSGITRRMIDIVK